MRYTSASSSLLALLASVNLAAALPATDSALTERQIIRQDLPSCSDSSIKPSDSSAYAKSSYLCATSSMPATTINITYSLKTLDYPISQSDTLAALASASTDPSLKENTITTSGDAKFAVQPFQCDGMSGWNNRAPTSQELGNALKGLKDLFTNTLKGKTLASATGIIGVGGGAVNVAAVQVFNAKTEFVPLNAQCK